MKRSIKYFLVLAFLSTTVSLFASVQTYRIRVPADEQSCVWNAYAHAKLFFEVTGREVRSYQCQGRFTMDAENINYQSDSLIIEYVSDLPLEILTTKFRTAESAIEGRYSSYQHCLDDLPHQSQIFESESGLKILRASCEKMTLGYKPNYQLQIDSYGVAKRNYNWVTISNLEQLSVPFKQAILGHLRELGASNITEYGSSFYFYRQNSIPLFSATAARYKSAQHCETQKINILNTLKTLNARWSTVECSMDRQLKNYYHLNVVYLGPHYLSDDFGLNSPQYYSMDECLADFDRFLDSSLTIHNAAGGVCEEQIGTDGVFAIKLFKRPLY